MLQVIANFWLHSWTHKDMYLSIGPMGVIHPILRSYHSQVTKVVQYFWRIFICYMKNVITIEHWFTILSIVEVWKWICNFPHFMGHVVTYPCWDYSWSMSIKGAPDYIVELMRTCICEHMPTGLKGVIYPMLRSYNSQVMKVVQCFKRTVISYIRIIITILCICCFLIILTFHISILSVVIKFMIICP